MCVAVLKVRLISRHKPDRSVAHRADHEELGQDVLPHRLMGPVRPRCAAPKAPPYDHGLGRLRRRKKTVVIGRHSSQRHVTAAHRRVRESLHAARQLRHRSCNRLRWRSLHACLPLESCSIVGRAESRSYRGLQPRAGHGTRDLAREEGLRGQSGPGDAGIQFIEHGGHHLRVELASGLADQLGPGHGRRPGGPVAPV